MRRAVQILIIAALTLSGGVAAAQTPSFTANGAQSTLASGIAAGATSFTVTTGEGARFPPTSSGQFYVTIYNATDYPAGYNDPTYEVVLVTAHTAASDTFTTNATVNAHNTSGKTYAVVATWTATDYNAVRSALVTFGTPQGISTTADPRFDSIGLGVAADGTSGSIKFAPNSAGNNASIFTYSASSTNTGLELWPDGTTQKAFFIFGRSDTTGDTAPDRNQAYMRIFAPTGANSVLGANYFNPVITFGANDGSNVPRAFEWGVEGNMTAGTYGEKKTYLWEFDSTGANGNTVFAVDQTANPRQFRFPWPSATEAGYYVRVGGRQISTQATDSVGGLDVSPGSVAASGTGNYTKNDSNTRTFAHFRVKPELRFGASNANTTLYLADIDSTNTSLTGATVFPLRVAFGGTELASINSSGYLGLNTASTNFQAQTYLQINGTSTSVDNHLARLLYADDSTLAPALKFVKSRGSSQAQFYRVQSGDVLASVAAAGSYNATNNTTVGTESASVALFQFTAAETFAGTGNLGTSFRLALTPVGSGTAAVALTVNGSGDVTMKAGGTLTTDGAVVLSGDNQPAQIAAATNDYAISATAAVTIVDSDQIRTITGMTGGADGRMHTLINDGAADSILILRQEDTGSTAANRFSMAADVVLEPNRAANFWYDSTASRWRLLSTTATAGAMRDYLPFDYSELIGPAGADTKEATEPWNYAIIGTGGTQVKIAGDATHRGIYRLGSGTTANSGGLLQTDLTAFRLSGGEFAEFIVNVDTTTNTTIRLGFLDTATSTDVTDGAYIEIPASTSPTCKTANNSTRTTSSAIATIATATWYRMRIEVDNTAANVTCSIFDANGNSLGSQTNSANIPTGAGRETGHGIIATNSGTVATNAVQIDYLAVGTKRAVIR